MQNLQEFVERAWRVGGEIDLDGIGYGRIHWGNRQDIKLVPSSYYRLLAGLAAITGSRSAFEVGTHWGGSTLAIYRGLQRNATEPKVVTVDITKESDNFIPKFKDVDIIKVVGDANCTQTVVEIKKHLEKVDFLYVDAAHVALPTLSTFVIYNALLAPKIAVFDDIQLSDEMKAFWSVIRNGFPNASVNVSDFLPEARGRECGFGILLLTNIRT